MAARRLRLLTLEDLNLTARTESLPEHSLRSQGTPAPAREDREMGADAAAAAWKSRRRNTAQLLRRLEEGKISLMPSKDHRSRRQETGQKRWLRRTPDPGGWCSGACRRRGPAPVAGCCTGAPTPALRRLAPASRERAEWDPAPLRSGDLCCLDPAVASFSCARARSINKSKSILRVK
nr:unnamed protein product [Digitaria exilis]